MVGEIRVFFYKGHGAPLTAFSSALGSTGSTYKGGGSDMPGSPASSKLTDMVGNVRISDHARFSGLDGDMKG